MELVDEYIALLDEPKKEWVASMVNFMREVFPDVEETLSNKMPTYKGDGYYIAFAAQKNYFTFHTDNMMVLSLKKELIPSAFMGKSYAKIKYSNEGAVECMMDACKEIVDHHNTTWHERVRSYLGRSQEQVPKEFFLRNNPCSDVRLPEPKSVQRIC